MDAWFPKLNSRGQVVSGSGSIWFWESYRNLSVPANFRQIGGGWSPAFLDNSWVIFNNGVSVSTFDLVNNKTIVRPHESYSLIVAAVGRYIGWLQGIVTLGGNNYDGVGQAISKSGKNVAWITPYQSEARSLMINKEIISQSGHPYVGAINQLDIGDLGLVWTTFDGPNRKVWGILNNETNIRDLTVRSWEESHICDTPKGPWIIGTNQDGTNARPFLSKMGQFRHGDFFYGDSIWYNDRLVIVGSSAQGEPLYWEVDIDVLNVDLTTLDGTTPVPPDPNTGDDMQEQIDQLTLRVTNLESQNVSQQNEINNLKSRVSKLEAAKPSDSRIVAIKSARGKYMRDDWDDSLAHFDRDTAGEGEFYTLESHNSNPPNPNPVPPDNQPISDALVTDGKFFRRNNEIVRVKRFTSFKLLNLFEKGNDIKPILNQFAGYNSARVFAYTPKKDWGDEAWDFPDKLATHEFMLMMGEAGFDVSLCLITDDDRAMIDKAKELISYLSVNPVSNLTLEAVNEPEVHEKIDPTELKNALTNSPYLYSSGIYLDNKKFYGKFWLRHSPRDSQWYRKGGHELMEAWDGGGPNFPDEPSLKMPGIQDEPIKPNETGYDVKGFYEYAASCGLMGSGATFHCESGKFSRLLTQPEADCKDAFLIGLNMYPLDAANGAYRRIDESETGRTYVVGNYAIRIHQPGTSFPESGWNPMDDIGVCWRR